VKQGIGIPICTPVLITRRQESWERGKGAEEKVKKLPVLAQRYVQAHEYPSVIACAISRYVKSNDKV